jgi:hypothetical protein
MRTVHEPIEFRQQMPTGCQPELLKHDRGVECILLRHEQDASRGFLEACYQLDMSKYGDMMGQTAPIITIFTWRGERFYGEVLELR